MFIKKRKGLIYIIAILVIMLVIMILLKANTLRSINNITLIRETINKPITSSTHTLFSLKDMNNITYLYSTVKKGTEQPNLELDKKSTEFLNLWDQVTSLKILRSGYPNELFSSTINYYGIQTTFEYKDIRHTFTLYINPSTYTILIQKQNMNSEEIPKKQFYIELEPNKETIKLIKDLIQ